MGMITPGLPSWVELGSPDIDVARRFYTELFGWTATVSDEPEAGGYTTFATDGKAVAAVGPLQGEGQPPVWTTYFATDDVAETARRVGSAGGKVLLTPMDVMGYGRMAVFLDSTGAAFAAWQAGSMTGEEVQGVPGSRTWCELMTRDPEGAKSFYGAVLGWDARDVSYEDGTYTLWQVGAATAGGMMPMVGEMWPAELPAHWMVYFEVADAQASAARVEELGGRVSVPPTETAAGTFAVVGDPHGATFSIMKSNPDYAP